MSAIAFTVQGFGVTLDQRAAALKAMTGRFRARDIARVLTKAGVTDAPGQTYTLERVVDRLLQSERKAGRIRTTTPRGMWERVA